MYLRRKLDAFFEELEGRRSAQAMIARGSRQVGKTESINHFARQTYERVIETNFVRDEKYKGIMKIGSTPSRISARFF